MSKKRRRIIECDVCGKLFFNNKDRIRKYCSVNCYRDFQRSGKYTIDVNRKGSNKKCFVCNNIFYASKNSKQRFCSRECYLVDHSKDMKISECPVCKKEFRKNNIHKFCSHECYYKDHEKEWVNKNCPVCGKEFKQAIIGRKKDRKTCSRKCGYILSAGSKIRKEKISKSLIEQYINGERNIVTQYKSGYFYSKKNKMELHYRSSYELIAYKILEQLSKVLYYEIETLSIEYNFKNIIRNTIPDILVTYIDGSKELIEVKPEYLINSDKRTNVKLNAMRDYAKSNKWNFSVWSESNLGLK